MPSDPESFLGKLMDQFRAVAQTETTIGKEFVVGDYTLIPVSKVSLGLGAGGGQHTGDKSPREGVGGGGGVTVDPVAFIAIKGGEISVLRIKKAGALEAVLEHIPEIQKLVAKKGKPSADAEAEQEAPEPE